MKQSYTRFLLALLLLMPVSMQAQNAPLEFIENKGQWLEPFLYKARAAGGDIFLEDNRITYLLHAADNAQKVHDVKHGYAKQPQTLRFHAYRMVFEGAQKAEEIKAAKFQKHYYNYFLDKDSANWRSQIHPAHNVDYKNLYKGIDLHLASANRMLKYDFIVHPGADVSQIKLKFEGADGLAVKNRKLEIHTSVGTVNEMEPYAYQHIEGEKKEVKCRYVLRDGRVSFDFPNGYNTSATLIIDPTVVFSTYSGSTADNWGFTATYDNQGNFYAGGIAQGTGFPATTGAFQTTFAGGGSGSGNPIMSWDMAIMKINAAGNAMVYTTYLGGADNEQPHSMVVDNNNNLIVAGRTYSSNFPVQNAYDNSYNGAADIVITKFNTTGSALIGSTYIGGSGDDGVNVSSLWSVVTDLKHNYGDDARSEVIVDNAGNVYMAASTFSSDFPTVNAHQNTLQGGQDAIAFKLTPNLNNLQWSTYLGGSGNDAAYVLALSTTQSALYVSGGTTNSNFPSTPGTFQPSYGGGSADGYILKFQNGGSYNLQRGTFLGTGNYDQSYGVQVDKQNRVYAMGQTIGGTFPVTANVYSNPGSSQFIIKLDSNLTTNIYSTVYGSGNSAATNISPVAFLVDTCEQVYISGWGGSIANSGSTTVGMPVTSNAVKSTTDGNDFYFIVLSKDASTLLYGTFYGANNLGEHVDGGTSRFDKNGVVYQGICAGCGGSSAFPTTPGALSNTNNNSNCNYGALKIAFDFVLFADAAAGPATVGCAPLAVNFSNNSVYATSYIWDFGDGSPTDTSTAPSHTFTTPGTYTVKLIALNSNACNQTSDTDYITIIVDGSSVKADFIPTITQSCDPYEASFNNTSTAAGPNAQFFWSFGDGTTFTGRNPPSHTYPDTGTYIVTLLVVDTSACNKRDSISRIITFSSAFVRAGFVSDTVCVGTPVQFSNGSTNAQSYNWAFGDGDTSTVGAPSHNYTAPGTYTVTLIAANPGTCNKLDTAVQTVVVWGTPYADFSYDPIIPIPNEPLKFTNKSKDATSFYWAFGDGNSSTDVNPKHLYKRTGRYQVCLQASNAFGCMSRICKYVDAEISPAIDVPTGFSPNGDGSNDILYVRGAAVETLSFRVYNRWGEKVFETDDMNRGWDGTFKGKPQEMEAYAWVLDATFVDGSSVNRTGNVTLIR